MSANGSPESCSPTPSPERMRRLEVWGGNGRRTNNSKCPACAPGCTAARTARRSGAATFIICHRVLPAAYRASCWQTSAGTADLFWPLASDSAI